jgi:hypothetical protein
MTVIEAPPSLTQTIGRLRFDPLGYVMYALPWGQPGTALADESGPEPWQRAVLQTLGDALHRRDRTSDEAVRRAVASGHGIGKSALVAWIILWALSTLRDTRGALALTFAYPVERRNVEQESRIQQKLAVLKRRIV